MFALRPLPLLKFVYLYDHSIVTILEPPYSCLSYHFVISTCVMFPSVYTRVFLLIPCKACPYYNPYICTAYCNPSVMKWM